MIRENKIKINPTNRILSSKISKTLPQFVGVSDMNELLDKLQFANCFSEQRDKLIIEILYSTGIRLSELICIKTKDVNHQKRQIKVLGKRNKERIIPLTMELINSIDKYLILRNQQKIIDISYLLITDSGKKINSSMVYRKVNKLLNGVTIK